MTSMRFSCDMILTCTIQFDIEGEDEMRYMLHNLLLYTLHNIPGHNSLNSTSTGSFFIYETIAAWHVI